MAGIQDFQEFADDFNGAVAALPTSADPATPWLIDDTSSAGAPTYTKGTSTAVLTLASTSEVENVALHFGYALDFDIDLIMRAEFGVKVSGCTTGTELVFGLGSARNDTTDSVTANAWFKMVGATSTTAVVVETDDGVTDNDDVATGASLATTYKRFVIDFIDDIRHERLHGRIAADCADPESREHKRRRSHCRLHQDRITSIRLADDTRRTNHNGCRRCVSEL